MNNKFSRAKNYCFRLLKLRPRSESEFRLKLRLKKYDADLIEQTIQYLRSIGYIDDKEFARFWIGSRITRPLGMRRLFYELKQKGVKESIINQAASEFSDAKGKETKIVSDLAKKKFAQSRSKDKLRAKQNVYAYLARRGFSSGDIVEALREL